MLHIAFHSPYDQLDERYMNQYMNIIANQLN